MNDVYDTLMRAADLIEERGWVKGEGWVTDLTPDDSKLCLEGGIMAALGLRVPAHTVDDRKFLPLVTCPAYRAVVTYLDRDEVGVEERGFTGEPLYWWNDDQETAERVIEVLRAAAATSLAKDAAVAARERAAEGVSA